MDNTITLKIELPQSVIEKLESVIVETVTRTLTERIEKVRASPRMYNRKETASLLRITLQTLRVYEFRESFCRKKLAKEFYIQRNQLRHSSTHSVVNTHAEFLDPCQVKLIP